MVKGWLLRRKSNKLYVKARYSLYLCEADNPDFRDLKPYMWLMQSDYRVKNWAIIFTTKEKAVNFIKEKGLDQDKNNRYEVISANGYV